MSTKTTEWTREQQLKWQKQCLLEDMEDIEREKRADSLDQYLGRSERRAG